MPVTTTIDESAKTKYLCIHYFQHFHAAAINCMRFPLKSTTTMVQTNRRQKRKVVENTDPIHMRMQRSTLR